MDKKNFNFFGVFGVLIIILLSVYFVLAAASAPTTLLFNQNVTFDYDEGNFSVNWTTGGGDEVNYSIYIYTGGTFFTKAENDSDTGYSFNNFTEANYTFIIEAVNATLNATNSTSNISMYVDRTAPAIELPKYSNATFKKNTSTLTLNISVIDAKSGLTGSVCIVDVNGTNVSLAVDNGWCNSTAFNLTGLADGNQTISVYVNDTVNILGLNSSFVVFVDSTAPTATATCIPSNPTDNGEKVTCTCSGGDSGTGVASTTADSVTITSTAGSFTYDCSVTDNAGNSASATATFIVTGGGGGTSSGSGGETTQTKSNTFT